MKTFALFLLLASSGLAQTSSSEKDWVFIDFSTKNNLITDVYSFRKSSVISTGLYTYKAWVKWRRLKDPKIHHTFWLVETDCRAKQLRFLQIANYDTNGESMGNRSYHDNFEDPPPDSLGEGIVNEVCKQALRKQ